MNHAQEAAIAADLQDVVKKHFPGVSSMVLVKAAYGAIKPINSIVNAASEQFSSVRNRQLSEGTETSAILSLPTEVKCRIWELCVLHDNQQPEQSRASRQLIRVGSRLHIHLMSLCKQKWVCAAAHAVQPAITRVCREIRQDALKIFYSSNHFVVELNNSKDIANATIETRCFASKWFHSIGPENSKHLRHVYWRFPVRSDYCVHDIYAAQELLKKYRVPRRLLNEMEFQLAISVGNCQKCDQKSGQKFGQKVHEYSTSFADDEDLIDYSDEEIWGAR